MLLKLILENYIPLLAGGIKRIEIDFDNLVNLIVGVNSSGKSSIMKELNPWPPENANFVTGRKFVLTYYKGKYYKLDSFTHKGTGHSFGVSEEIEGEYEELNTGGTFSVQKELVKQHFGLDNNLIRALTAIKLTDRFSNMSINRRKDLLMEIYPNDTAYALNVYNKLRAERNELKAAIKNQITRYTEENKKLEYINSTGTELLEERVRLLEDDIKKALLLQGELASTYDDTVRDDLNEHNKLVTSLLNAKVFTYLTREQVEEEIKKYNELIIRTRESLTAVKANIASETSNLSGYEELLNDKEAFGTQLSLLREEMSRNSTESQLIRNRLKDLPIFGEKEIDITSLLSHIDTLKSYISNVILASNQEITLNDYREKQQEYEELATRIRETKTNLEDISHKIKHIENKENVTCPECSSNFIPGVGKEDLPKLQSTLSNLKDNYTNLRNKALELKLILDNDLEWFNSYSNLVNYVNRVGNRTIAEIIRVFKVGKQEPSALINALDYCGKFHSLDKNYASIMEEFKLLDERRERFNNNEFLQDSLEHIKLLEEDNIRYMELLRTYEDKLSYFNNLLNDMNSYEDNLNNLRQVRAKLLEKVFNNSKSRLRSLLEKHITELTTEKESNLANIIKNKSLVAVIDNISEDIDKLKAKLNKVEILLNGLCPNKGLIGRLMGEFLETIVGNVNNHLTDIWEGTLYLKPCTKDNDDLTYKFPLVTGGYQPTPDISDGSAGQCDIVDFLFRYVILEYVDYPFPLIIDEVGVNLDSINRASFFSWLKDFLSNNSNRQVAIVSHYLTSQVEFFNDPSVICVKEGDLEIPFKDINKNTTITHS